jgi:archaellum biogenesis ATPase FlaH
MRKSLPFLKDEYFTVEEDRVLFKEIKDFILKYNNPPTADALSIEIDNIGSLTEDQVKSITGVIEELNNDKIDTNIDWLVDNTEKFCQEKAIYHAISTSIEIMNSKNGSLTKGAIPQLLSDALAVSFDPNVGHDYLEEFDERFEYYHRVEERIPFDLDFFNKITKNGVPKKTLNVCLAGTGVGKSLFMCHVAASCLNLGKNVLYITLELAEEEVAKRIDANLMNISFEDLMSLPKEMYEQKATRLKNKTDGKFIIKEYPTAGASTIHFKALLNELNLKKSFKPDIIFIDYLNICMSARIKPGGNVNSYTYIKSIAEELRGLAVEYCVPIFTATQTTRSGYCLALDTKVFVNNQKTNIVDIKIGDRIDTFGGQNIVKQIFPITEKKAYKITLANGKTIICSKEHLFPTKDGEKSIKRGIKIGEYLQVK